MHIDISIFMHISILMCRVLHNLFLSHNTKGNVFILCLLCVSLKENIQGKIATRKLNLSI